MSLIQEALRRQREEGGSGPVPTAPAAPTPAPAPAVTAGVRAAVAPPIPRPPPLPGVQQVTAQPTPEPAPIDEGNEKESVEERPRRKLAVVIGIVALVVLLAAVGLGMLFFAFQQWNKSKTAQHVAITTHATPVVGTAPEAGAAVATAPLAPPTPVAPGAPAVSEMPPVSTPTAAASKPAAVAAPPVEQTPPAGPQTPPWPLLKVTGVVGKGMRGAATINGRILAIGEKVDGAEVVAIGDYGVKLEYEGETRFVKVGSSSE